MDIIFGVNPHLRDLPPPPPSDGPPPLPVPRPTWSVLSEIEEIRAMYETRCLLPLELRNLLDDWPRTQLQEMALRLDRRERADWLNVLVARLEISAKQKALYQEDVAEQIALWGDHALRKAHETFTSIFDAFAMEEEIWNRAMTFQTPMYLPRSPAVPPNNRLIRKSRSLSIFDAEPWQLQSDCDSVEEQQLLIEQLYASVRRPAKRHVPEPLGRPLAWEPVFDNPVAANEVAGDMMIPTITSPG